MNKHRRKYWKLLDYLVKRELYHTTDPIIKKRLDKIAVHAVENLIENKQPKRAHRGASVSTGPGTLMKAGQRKGS